MGFNCGIVGLPNVGKSTLFNALTATAAAAAANYPFCTIEPNVGRVPVPDPRLDGAGAHREVGQDHRLPSSRSRTSPAWCGVRARARVWATSSWVRSARSTPSCTSCAASRTPTSIHVEGAVDPLRDAELIETELLLADIESLERQKDGLVKRAKGQDKEAKARLDLLERILPAMEAARRPARSSSPRRGARPAARASTC